MSLALPALISLEAVQRLMDSLSATLGLSLSLVDVNGVVLTQAGWQGLCRHFHRTVPTAEQLCRRSDHSALACLATADCPPLIEYTCLNGLACVGVPLRLGDRPLGALFCSQFFHSPPDEARFREQAQRHGFDAEAYLAAAGQVPIRSREEVRSALQAMQSLIDLMLEMARQKMELMAARKRLGRSERRLRRQHEALVRLETLRTETRDSGELIRQALELLARVLVVERVGVWRFCADGRRLVALDLYQQSRHAHEAGQVVEMKHCPAYFTALEQDRGIAAEDALTDPRTVELGEAYLAPLGIASMLDTPLWVGDRMAGVLCCEHVGGRRVWSTDEQTFAGAVADILSQALENDERRRAEEALRESERRLTAMMCHLPGLAYRTSNEPGWPMEFVSDGCRQLTGYAPEDFLPPRRLNLNDLVVPDDRERAAWEMAAAVAARRPYRLQYRIRHADGSERWLWEQGQAVHPERGKPFLEGFVTDITESKTMERLKEEMLSMFSHELRTPLTGIAGFTEFLLQHPVPAEEREDILQTVQKETDRLLELLDNLLDLQQIRAGRMRYEMRPVVVPALLAEVAGLYRCVSKRHSFSVDCPEDLPPVLGDPDRLLQGLRNLLSNGVKYSPDGGPIELGARCDGMAVAIWVRDRGVGIPPEQQARVFERFYRLDRGDSRRTSGAGLGLALVKEIVEAHGGGVSVESRAGEGTTFHLRLPLAAAKSEPMASA